MLKECFPTNLCDLLLPKCSLGSSKNIQIRLNKSYPLACKLFQNKPPLEYNFGADLAYFGSVLVSVCRSLGLRASLRRSWTALGGYWAVLGAAWTDQKIIKEIRYRKKSFVLESVLGLLGGILGRLRRHLGAVERRLWAATAVPWAGTSRLVGQSSRRMGWKQQSRRPEPQSCRSEQQLNGLEQQSCVLEQQSFGPEQQSCRPEQHSCWVEQHSNGLDSPMGSKNHFLPARIDSRDSLTLPGAPRSSQKLDK